MECMVITGWKVNLMPNQALQRTAAGHRGCKRRVSWPPSLNLGRWKPAVLHPVTLEFDPLDDLLVGAIKQE